MPDIRNSDAPLHVWKDETETKQMRSFAAEIVANSCNPQALEAAQWVLDNGDTDERLSVVNMLGKRLLRLPQKKIARLLKYATRDSIEIVKITAKYELNKLNTLSDVDPEIWRIIID